MGFFGLMRLPKAATWACPRLVVRTLLLHGVAALCFASTLTAAPPPAEQPASAPVSAAAASTATSHSTSAPVASAAHLEVKGSTTRLSFDVDAPVFGRAYLVSNPDRVVIDVSEVDFKIDPSVGAPPSAGSAGARSLGGAIGAFRFGLIEPGKSRIVVDLVRPVRVIRAETSIQPNGKEAFVLELQDTDQVAFRASVAERPPSPAPAVATPPKEDTAPPLAPNLPVVVLDPGHGGIDTGAVGPTGVEEKNVTFAFARAVAETLRADGQVNVVLTRASDVFVPLETRVRIARKANASLFMSIHADTIVGAGSVSGATVYTLSDKASDREAARVAASENEADAAGGLSAVPSADEDEVKDILLGLTQRETRAYSNFFADSLMKNWSSSGDLNHNPHRSARFVVLKAPDVPSVLLELGYLSSAKDLRSLTNDAWRKRASTSVAHAIEQFFAARGAVGGGRAPGDVPTATASAPSPASPFEAASKLRDMEPPRAAAP